VLAQQRDELVHGQAGFTDQRTQGARLDAAVVWHGDCRRMGGHRHDDVTTLVTCDAEPGSLEGCDCLAAGDLRQRWQLGSDLGWELDLPGFDRQR